MRADGFPRNPHGPACPGLVRCGVRGFSAPERESPGRFMADAWICRSPLAGDAFAASESKPRLQDQDQNQKRFALLRSASYFLLSGQEKVAKEKATPLTRLADILSARSALGLRGLSTGHPALTTNWPTSGNRSMRCLNSGIHALAMSATLRAFLRPTAASEGPRVEQRAIVVRTFRTSRSKSWSKGWARGWSGSFRCTGVVWWCRFGVAGVRSWP